MNPRKLWPRRWWARVLVVVALLLVALRVSLPWSLPPVLDALAGRFGLTARFDGIELSLTGLRGSLRGLEVRALPDPGTPEDPGAEVLRLDYAGFDLAFGRLLTGDLVVDLVELDGLEAWLDRLDDGTWSIEKHLPELGGDEPTRDASSSVTLDRFAELDLRLPLEVRVARLQAVRVNVRDRSQGVDTHLDLDLTASDLGHPTRPARLGLRAGSPALLGSLWCDGSLVTGDRQLEASWKVRMERLEASTIAAWFAPEQPLPFDVVDLLSEGDLKLSPEGVARAARADLGLGHLRVDLDHRRTVDAHLNVTEVVLDPEGGVPSARLAGAVALPGMAERVGVEGEFCPDPVHPRARFELDAQHVTIERLTDWLATRGLAPDLGEHGAHSGGTVELEATRAENGDWTARAAVRDVFLERAPAPGAGTSGPAGLRLAALAALELEGLFLAGDGGLTRLERFELRGPELDLRRDTRGNWHALGLRTLSQSAPDPALGTDPGPGSEQSAAPVPQDPVPSAHADGDDEPIGPRVELGLLRLEAPRVRLRDEARERPLDLLLGEGSLELRDLTYEPDPSGPAPGPARLRVDARVPALFESLSLQGELELGPALDRITCDLELGGSGLAGETVRSELEALGISTTSSAGCDLGGRLRLTAQREADALHADLTVEQVAWTEDGGAREWLALDRLELRDARMLEGVPHVSALVVDGVRLAASREEDGSLLALGLRLPPPAGSAEAGSTDAGAASDPVPAGEDLPEARLPFLPPFVLDRFELGGVALEWNDADPPTAFREGDGGPLQVPLTLACELDGLDTREARRTWELRGELGSPGLVERATCHVRAVREPDAVEFDVELEVRGLEGGAWQVYLPPTWALDTRDGQLTCRLHARAAHHPEGGMSLDLGARDLTWSEGGTELLRVPEARLAVARVDPPEGLLLVNELRVSDLGLAARRTADGGLWVAGLRLGDDARRPRHAPTPAPDVREGEAAVRYGLPTVTIGALELVASDLRFVDELEGGQELSLRASLRADGPLELLDEDVNQLAPMKLVAELSGSRGADEGLLLESARATFVSQPLRDPLDVDVDLVLDGLDGAALTRVLPALGERVDLSGIRGGHLEGSLDAVLDVRRRTPLDIDPTRGVAGSLELTGVTWSPVREEAPAFELESVRMEFRPYVPGTPRLHVSELSVEGVRGAAHRTREGLASMGVVLPIGAAPAEPMGDAASPASGDTAGTRPGPVAAAAPPFELRLDRLGVRDVTWDLWDDTHDPATHVPLEDLELDLIGLSTADRARPFRLHLAAYAGEVELPERVVADNALEGLVGATAGVLGGRKDAFRLERRRWMDRFELDANLTLGSTPKGRVAMELRGLELTTFRGQAREAGVVVGDGLLDTDLEANLGEDGRTTLDVVPKFTFLSLSEPPDGPISRYLALPAPLDTVLFLLKDDQGRHVLPIHTTVDSNGLGSGAALSAVTEAVASLIANAVASAPLRLGGTALDLADGVMSKPLGLVDDVLGGIPGAGLLGLGEEALLTELDLEFEPASNVPLGVTREELEALARATRKGRDLELRADLAPADLEAAARIANPPRDELLALAAELLARRSDLMARRAPAELTATRSWVDGTGEDAARAAAALREIDAGLATVERALDGVWERLRPGAERRAAARTREAASAIGAERMRAVRMALLALGATPERLRVRPARPVALEGLEFGRVLVRPPGARTTPEVPAGGGPPEADGPDAAQGIDGAAGTPSDAVPPPAQADGAPDAENPAADPGAGD